MKQFKLVFSYNETKKSKGKKTEVKEREDTFYLYLDNETGTFEFNKEDDEHSFIISHEHYHILDVYFSGYEPASDYDAILNVYYADILLYKIDATDLQHSSHLSYKLLLDMLLCLKA
jgi:hypothetical protein